MFWLLRSDKTFNFKIALVGSNAMQDVILRICKSSPTSVTILIMSYSMQFLRNVHHELSFHYLQAQRKIATVKLCENNVNIVILKIYMWIWKTRCLLFSLIWVETTEFLIILSRNWKEFCNICWFETDFNLPKMFYDIFSTWTLLFV